MRDGPPGWVISWQSVGGPLAQVISWELRDGLRIEVLLRQSVELVEILKQNVSMCVSMDKFEIGEEDLIILS